MELPNRPVKDPYQEIPVKDFSYVNTQSKVSKNKGPKTRDIILFCIALVLLGIGAFTYGHYTKTVKVAAKKTTNQQLPVVVKLKPATTQTTSYTSNSFGFTINYPTNWSVNPSGSTSVTITSPATGLTADTGKSVDGKIVLSFLNQGQVPTAFGAGSVAVLNSLDLNYNNPTSDQAAQTYISFVQYPATVTKGGLDAIYITGNNGYEKDGPIPLTDVKEVSPLIIFSFRQCMNSACSTTIPLTISSNMWASSNFSSPITKMIESIVFS